MSTPIRGTTTRYVTSPRHYAPKHPSSNVGANSQLGKTLQNRMGASRHSTPQKYVLQSVNGLY